MVLGCREILNCWSNTSELAGRDFNLVCVEERKGFRGFLRVSGERDSSGRSERVDLPGDLDVSCSLFRDCDRSLLSWDSWWAGDSGWEGGSRLGGRDEVFSRLSSD